MVYRKIPLILEMHLKIIWSMMSIMYFQILQPKEQMIQILMVNNFQPRSLEWTNIGNSCTALLVTSLPETGISMFFILLALHCFICLKMFTIKFLKNQ